jgi:trypsin-like peptidase
MRTNSPLLKGAILIATLLLPAVVARAQEEHIYLIKMFDCAHQPAQRSQTGFRVRGLKGIVTALHGVADCGRVTASSRKGLFLDQALNFVRVDIDRDVALLSSAQLERADGGLELAASVAWESLGTVKVYGHPYGISSLETALSLRNPPLNPLKDLLPPSPLSALMERRSPNHLINVLNLQGNLLPGHSGAPILDARGRVVAVANGGLKEGFAGISWAVPFQDIEWDNVGSSGRLKTLAQQDPNILFAADSTSIENPPNNFCGQISKLVIASQTGFISIVGEPNREGQAGNFKSKIELPGASRSSVEPYNSVQYAVYASEDIGKIDSQFYSLATNLSDCLTGWNKKEYKDEPVDIRLL